MEVEGERGGKCWLVFSVIFCATGNNTVFDLPLQSVACSDFDESGKVKSCFIPQLLLHT